MLEKHKEHKNICIIVGYNNFNKNITFRNKFNFDEGGCALYTHRADKKTILSLSKVLMWFHNQNRI